VEVRGVERVVDEFLLTQQRNAASLLARDDFLVAAYGRLEVVFNELSENDLSTGFDRFFNAMQDLSLNVESEATRGLVVQQALALRDLVSVIHNSMRDYYAQLNGDVEVQVAKVNELLVEIAELNRQVTSHEGNGLMTANDLRDRRDQKLIELARIIDVTTVEQENGAVNVSTRGMPLVLLTSVFKLETKTTVSGTTGLPTVQAVFVEGGSPLQARSGRLAATLDTRDNILASFMDDLNRFVAEFIFEFNRLHVQGAGAVALTSVTSEHAVTDASVSLDSIDMGFVPQPGTFRVVNGTVTVAVISNGTGEVNEYRVPVDLDGVGADDSLNDFVARFNATVPAGTLQASVDATGHLQIAALNPVANGFYFSEDTSGLLATLGVNTFWSGQDAGTMHVNPAIRADERLVTTGKTTAAGDTDNLMEMLQLRDRRVADGGSKTFEEHYRSIVGRLGTEAMLTNNRRAVRNDLSMRLENERQVISGVSLDEEMVKLIQFQRAYQAAARVISVSDTMIDTLINRT
jgi:flagellar hook-associated protein 1 FlgK